MLTRLLAGLVLLAATALPAGKVPRPAPEFAIKLTNGEQLLLSQFRGKVVALEFLLTTCPACQEASRLLEKLYQEYGPKGFQPIGVAFNDMAIMLVPDYVKEHRLSFPVGVGTRESVLDFLQHPPFLRMLVPQLVFVDRKGVIRAQYAADDPFFADKEKNMRLQVESLLAEGAVGASPQKPASGSRPKKGSGVK